MNLTARSAARRTCPFGSERRALNLDRTVRSPNFSAIEQAQTRCRGRGSLDHTSNTLVSSAGRKGTNCNPTLNLYESVTAGFCQRRGRQPAKPPQRPFGSSEQPQALRGCLAGANPGPANSPTLYNTRRHKSSRTSNSYRSPLSLVRCPLQKPLAIHRDP